MRAGREITLPERALGTRFGVDNESRHGGPADVARVFLARALSTGRRANDSYSGSHALTTAESSEYRARNRGEPFPRDAGRLPRDESGPTRVCLH